jgi:hypothetical protein
LRSSAKNTTRIDIEMADPVFENNTRLTNAIMNSTFKRSFPLVADLNTDHECADILRQVVAYHFYTCRATLATDSAEYRCIVKGWLQEEPVRDANRQRRKSYLVFPTDLHRK